MEWTIFEEGRTLEEGLQQEEVKEVEMTTFAIDIATSIKYGHAKGWKRTAFELADIIKSNVDVITSLLDLPETIYIRIKPLKGRTHGLWTNSSKTLCIDPRRTNMDTLIETLFHELVHAEQYKQGRLVRKLNEEVRQYQDFWEGTPFKRPSNVRSKGRYQKYLNLPWEKEAFEREKTLTVQFIREIIR